MKWAYTARPFESEVLSSLEQVLAAAGADGWELVTIIPFPGMPPPLPPDLARRVQTADRLAAGARADSMRCTGCRGR